MNYVVILAGGSGTRFWPLSRKGQPKQFLSLCSDRPMLEQVVSRIRILIKKNNIFIASNRKYQKNINSCLSRLQVPARNVFFEPEGKNTLAPIAVMSRLISLADKEAVIAVLPSDHYIRNVPKFLANLSSAYETAKKGYIVTLGIVPKRPETGYGYIKIMPGKKIPGSAAHKVERLIEKPDLSSAKKLIKDKRFYWNSGMFIFKPDTFLQEVKKHSPRDYKVIEKIKNKKDATRLWKKLASISVDYAIMEKTSKMALIQAGFDWTDLGSWEALHAFAKKDRSGNVFQGKCLDLGSNGTLCWSRDGLLATIGLRNIIVVSTKEATLVCAKEKSQEVKKIVDLLKLKGLKKHI